MFEIDADWQVRAKSGIVRAGKQQFRIRDRQILNVSQAELIHVTGECVDAMPPYDPNAAPWARGYRPEKLITFETTAPDMLVSGTLALQGCIQRTQVRLHRKETMTLNRVGEP